MPFPAARSALPLAERLLVFLPMAFTRRLLPDVRYPDTVAARP